MSSPYADRRKDGLASLIKFARLLCGIVASFEQVIAGKYGDQPNILALLTAIKAACALLPAAEAEMDAFERPDGDAPSDPSMTAGINPAAPSPPDVQTGV